MPLGLLLLKTVPKAVLEPLKTFVAGAGAAKVSPPPMSFGRKVPEVRTVASGSALAAVLSSRIFKPFTAVPPPTSEKATRLLPLGPVTMRSRSSGNWCERPKSEIVAFEMVPAIPLTLMRVGYGEPGAFTRLGKVTGEALQKLPAEGLVVAASTK